VAFYGWDKAAGIHISNWLFGFWNQQKLGLGEEKHNINNFEVYGRKWKEQNWMKGNE
jgi:hypothetical protein